MSDQKISATGSKPIPNAADGAIANADRGSDENAATSTGEFTVSLDICAISHSDTTYRNEVSR